MVLIIDSDQSGNWMSLRKSCTLECLQPTADTLIDDGYQSDVSKLVIQTISITKDANMLMVMLQHTAQPIQVVFGLCNGLQTVSKSGSGHMVQFQLMLQLEIQKCHPNGEHQDLT